MESNAFPMKEVLKAMHGNSRVSLTEMLGVKSLSELPMRESFNLQPRDWKKLLHIHKAALRDPDGKRHVADITSDGTIENADKGFFANIYRRYLKPPVPMVVIANPRVPTAAEVESRLRKQTQLDKGNAIETHASAKQAAEDAVMQYFEKPSKQAMKNIQKKSKQAQESEQKAKEAHMRIGTDLTRSQEQLVSLARQKEFAARYPCRDDLDLFARQTRYAGSMGFIGPEGNCYIVVKKRRFMPVVEKSAKGLLDWYKHYIHGFTSSHANATIGASEQLPNSPLGRNLEIHSQMELNKYANKAGLVVFVGNLSEQDSDKPIEFKRLDDEVLHLSLHNPQHK